MSGGFQRPVTPEDAFGQRISALEESLRALLAPGQPFVIPLRSTDPPTTDPTNIWIFPDGRIRWRHLNPAGSAFVYREVVPTAPGSTTSPTAPAPPAAAPITRTASWGAIWSHSYRSTGAQRTDGGAVNLYYGSSGDSFNGINRSLVGFDYAAMASTLSGSTINRVWLRMVNLHAWYNSGVQVYFGIHNYSAKPSTWVGGGIPSSKIYSAKFGKPEDKTISLPITFAQAIRDGWGKGLALEAPSSSREYYGFAAGFGSGYVVPTLTVEYAK